jgi:hypothetical protein
VIGALTHSALDKEHQTDPKWVFPDDFGPTTFSPLELCDQFGQLSIHLIAFKFDSETIKSFLPNAGLFSRLKVNCDIIS